MLKLGEMTVRLSTPEERKNHERYVLVVGVGPASDEREMIVASGHYSDWLDTTMRRIVEMDSLILQRLATISERHGLTVAP